MKKFRTLLVGFMIITTGCSFNLIDDATNTPTVTPSITSTLDTVATASALAVEETQSALETQEAESLGETETAAAILMATRAVADTATAEFLTASPVPTSTPIPTSTPTSASSGGSVGFTNCQDSSGGRTKVRFENKTGEIAYLTFIGPETLYCAVAGGVSQVFIKSGVYSVTGNMCGGSYYTFGSHVINSTWKIILKC